MRYFFIHKHNMTKQRIARFFTIICYFGEFLHLFIEINEEFSWKIPNFWLRHARFGTHPPGPSRFLRHAKMARHAPIGTPLPHPGCHA